MPTSTRRSAGLARIACELHGKRGLDEYLAAVAAYAAANPDAEWITGGGWSLADFPGGLPRREDLDRVCPDRPVFLPNRDGHDAWVNSAALGPGRDHEGHRGPRRRPDRPRHRTARRSARSTRGRWTLVGAAGPAGDGGRSPPGDPREPALPPLAGHHELAGRVGDAVRGGCLSSPRRVGRADGARRRRAVVGAWRGPRADRVARRAPGEGAGGPVPADQREAHGATASSRTRPPSMLEPYLDVHGHADGQPWHGLHRPRGAARRRSSASTPSGSSRTSTPSAIARSDMRSMRSKPPGAPTAGPTPGRSSPTSRSSTPTTCRGSASSARWPTRSPTGRCSRSR